MKNDAFSASRRLFLLLVLGQAMTAVACGQSSQPEPGAAPKDASTPAGDAPGKSIRDVPIVVGQRAFNESASTGFTTEHTVSWSTSDLLVTSEGAVSATMDLDYDGPAVAADAFRDVLFWQVVADYRRGSTGDYMTRPLTDMMAARTTASTADEAHVEMAESFPLPPAANEAGSLSRLGVNLTWVRVYKRGSALVFHVFAGDGAGRDSGDMGSSRPAPEIRFSESSSVRGRFGYYDTIAEGQAQAGGFDYVRWIRANVKW